jgi:hypothetical protein
MAIVIHNIKGNDYAYDHNRVGAKVVSTYVGRSGGNGAIYKRTELYNPEITQQTPTEKPVEKAITKEEVTQQDTPYGKIYVSKSRIKAVGRQGDEYIISSIRYSPTGKFLSSNRSIVHSKEERDIIIGKNDIIISDKDLKKSYDNHIEPKKESKPISMKKYLQLQKEGKL